MNIGGYKLHIWCEGSGIPTVVLARVCSYDRAGMGYSDVGPTPRTSRQIAGELRRLIQKSGINGPILLVGGSLGGLNMRAFAYEYGESVAGIILVNASHEDQEERYRTANAAEEVLWFFKFVPFAAFVGVLRPLGFAPGLDPDSLLPGYLRKNGVPYSANAVLTEHFRIFTEPNGDTWMITTALVDDPQYLTEPFRISRTFKKELDGSRWNPTPCTAR